jgi:hypothetical protein
MASECVFSASMFWIDGLADFIFLTPQTGAGPESAIGVPMGRGRGVKVEGLCLF